MSEKSYNTDDGETFRNEREERRKQDYEQFKKLTPRVVRAMFISRRSKDKNNAIIKAKELGEFADATELMWFNFFARFAGHLEEAREILPPVDEMGNKIVYLFIDEKGPIAASWGKDDEWLETQRFDYRVELPSYNIVFKN